MSTSGPSPETSGGYASWIGSQQGNVVDAARIHDQNSSLGRARWGVGQREFIHNLKETYHPEGEKFQPKIWFELGVGPDAALVINALEEFGDGLEDKGLVMVEKDAGRLEAAKTELREHFEGRPDLLAKVDFDVEAGDAAEVLRRYPKKADVIHAQLLFQHLDSMERKNILQACDEKLNDNGLFIVADVAFNDWTARPSRRGIRGIFQWDDVILDKRFIHNFRYNVYRRNGKKDFADAKAIERMVLKESRRNRRNDFEILPQLGSITRVLDIRPGRDDDEIKYLGNIVGLPIKDTDTGEFAMSARRFRRRLNDPERREDIDYPSLVRVVARRKPRARVA